MTVSYSELVTQIRAYTEVDSSVLSDTIVNDFIKFAENRLFRDVDIDVFKSHQTANLTASNPFITLPGGSAPDPTSLGTVRYMQIFAPTGTPTREYLEQRDIRMNIGRIERLQGHRGIGHGGITTQFMLRLHPI